jgi:hypothetical protein
MNGKIFKNQKDYKQFGLSPLIGSMFCKKRAPKIEAMLERISVFPGV